jgi:hypothetical protein
MSASSANAASTHPADDDGIIMVEQTEKAVDEPDTVQARIHTGAETY